MFRSNLTNVSLVAVIAGPGGARVTLGMSNGEHLGGNPAERFINPTREPMLYADIALGYSNLQARRRLLAPRVPGPDPALSIQATTYFPIHGNWVRLRLAGNDPESLSLTLQFVVGVKAGFSVKLQAEIEGQLILELGVKPTQVASILNDVTDILRDGLGTVSPASIKSAPAAVAPVLKQVFDYLGDVEDSGEELGELSLTFAVDGGVGVGIWDTGINFASVGAQIRLAVPLEAIISLQGDLLAANLEAGLAISTQMASLFEAMGEGRLDNQELARQRDLIGAAALDLVESLFASYVDYIQDINLSCEMGVYVLGDIGQVADQTIPILVVSADIPVGKILVDGVNGIPRFVQGVKETTRAATLLAEMAIRAGLNAANKVSLGGIFPPPYNLGGHIQRPQGSVPPARPTTDWEGMAADLLDDVTCSVQFGYVGIEGISLGNFVRMAGGAADVTESLFIGAIVSARERNEKPLVDALRAAPSKVGQEALDLLIFNLQTVSVSFRPSIGASGTIGAEATIGAGASIGFEAELKASVILLALGNENYDEEDGTLLAGFDIPLELSASAGISLGEGVEISAEGGVTVGQSLANVTVKDWGRDLPAPAGLTIAGFELIDFVGTNRQDGSITGRGWMVLPMGGLVRADHFSVDAAGRVLEGTWSGVIELGPLGEIPVAAGQITDNGLVGKTDLKVGPSTLKADFRLRSNGLLFGNATGNLEIGGVALVDIHVSLTEDGSFQDTAQSLIAGTVSESKVWLTIQGDPTAGLTSVSDFGGATANLDVLVTSTGGTGVATIVIFGQPVVFNVEIWPDGSMIGAAKASIQTPWGSTLDADFVLDGTGVHGSGKIRILGAEFTSTNLRVAPGGKLTGSFTGILPVDGQVMVVPSLEITGEFLQGRTILDVAGHQAVALLLHVDRSGISGRFVNDLELFGGGKASAWVTIGNPIQVGGDIDRSFFTTLESGLRAGLLAGVSGAEAALQRELDKVAGYRAEIEDWDNTLVTLRADILVDQQDAKGLAEGAVRDAEAALNTAIRELDAAIDELSKVSGNVAAELARVGGIFRSASSTLSAAQGELNKANQAIGALAGWYNGLNAIAKGILWLGYQASRAALVAARDLAAKALGVAQQAFDKAAADLSRVEQQLAQNQALIDAKKLKEQLFADAQLRIEEASRNLETIIRILSDPSLDPRYIAALAGRAAVVGLLEGTERIISLLITGLEGATGLIEFVRQHGEAALVKVTKVGFRSTLRDLNNGFGELIVEAIVAGQPRRFVMSYDFKSGRNEDYVATIARSLAPTLAPDGAWDVSAWTDDATTGFTPSRTLWAYHFNSGAAARVGTVQVPGIVGTTPAVPGRFKVEGFPNALTGDQNALTSGGGGSAIMAANFLWGAHPGTVTFEGLTPGRTYRATFLSVGWDDAPTTRRILFGGPSGNFEVEQNQYGNNKGIRIDHTFTATAATHVVTLTPKAPETFHLYALALGIEGAVQVTLAGWKDTEFGADASNPAIAGDDADPDGDDIPNFLEYALRLDPGSPDASSFSRDVPVTLPGGVEGRRFTIPYQAGANDVVYRIRQSTDLKDWLDAFRLDLSTGVISALPGVTGEVDSAAQTVTVTVTDLGLFAPPSFWCLTVEKR